MHAAIATQAGSPESENEDWAGVAAPGLAVVLDGLSAPDGTGTGCRHGTPWFVSQLGPRLLTLAAEPANSPADALAEAIRQVAGLHPGCDLTHPGTPSATLVLLRVLDERTDYLALADAVLLLDTTDGLKVISDERSTTRWQERRRHRLPTAQPSSSATRPAHPGTPTGTQLTRRVLGRRRRSPGRQPSRHRDAPQQEPASRRAAQRRRQPTRRPIPARHLGGAARAAG